MKTKIVCVKFKNEYGWSKDYAFKTTECLECGDQVIVDVTDRGATMAVVSQTDNVPVSKATRWVIQKIDMRRHEQRVVREAKMEALLTRMAQRAEVLQKDEIYVYWAERDGEMARLVAKYNDLVLEQAHS